MVQFLQLKDETLQALQDLPAHHSQATLQPILGLIYYLQPFIAGLSNETIFLHEQLTEWDWNPSTDATFQCLKSWICSTLLRTILACYDKIKLFIIQTDLGLDTALIQDGCLIAFTSKTLTNVEQQYANIECQCLSIFFSA